MRFQYNTGNEIDSFENFKVSTNYHVVLTDISSKTLENTQKFMPNSQLIHVTELMLLTLARRRVLGHKVPGLRHLYQPIKSKINQRLNNSPKKLIQTIAKII